MDVLCFGESTGSIDLSVSGGIAPYTYLWSTGEVTQDINGIPAGIYDVDVFDDNNCLAELQVTITEPLIPILLSETHTDALCIGGDQGTIDLSVSEELLVIRLYGITMRPQRMFLISLQVSTPLK